MDWQNLLIFGAFITNLFFSFIIHLRSKKTKANITIEITAFGITLWCLAMILYRFSDASYAITATKLLYLFPTFIPTGLVLFGLFFPNRSIKPLFLYGIILANILMVGLTMIGSSVIQGVEIVPGEEKIIKFGWAYYGLYNLYITGFFISAYGVLFRQYLKASAFHKMQILYILLGTTTASIPAMITNLNLPTYFNYFGLNWVGQLFTIFWVGGLAYAIVKHRFLSVRFIVARTITYSILISLIAGVYSGIVFWVSNSFFQGQVDSSQAVVYAVLAIFVALTFQPLKTYIENFTDSMFYKSQYSSNELLASLTKIMATTLSFNNLTQKTLQELLANIKVTRGAFLIFDKDNTYQIVHEGYPSQPVYEINLMKWFYEKRRTLISEEEEDSEIKQRLINIDASVILPLRVGDQAEGILILGDKKSGEMYSSQDIQVLEIFGPEVSVAINNSKSYEEIKRFNITLSEEVNKATKDLKAANEKLKVVDKLKDDFVSLASHELRTPMTAIKSYLWMALDGRGGPLTEKQKYYLDRSYKSTDRLINLVNDMLNISRIESGRITLEKQPVALEGVVKEVIEEIAPRSQELGIKVVLSPSETLPHVFIDVNKIKEVLFNLIGNSLKFTPQGGTVTLSYQVRDLFVYVTVTDTGVGISPEDQSKLFQKFGMIMSSYSGSKQVQGTGLGLYMSKKIIELHNGQMEVHSEGKGTGSSFSFSLPIATQQDIQAYNTQAKNPNEVHVGLEHMGV